MTLPILVDPALLGSSAAIETAGAATMGGAGTGAAPAITGLVPAGSDSVSRIAAEALRARGAATMGAVTQFAAMRELFAATVGLNGVGYAASEFLNTVALTI